MERLEHPLGKRCPNGYRRDSKTKLCVKKGHSGTPVPNPVPTPVPTPTPSPTPSPNPNQSRCKVDCEAIGKICNPETKRCVLKDGAVGRRILQTLQKRISGPFTRSDAKYTRQYIRNRIYPMTPEVAHAAVSSERYLWDAYQKNRGSLVRYRYPKYVPRTFSRTYQVPEAEITKNRFDQIGKSAFENRWGHRAWKNISSGIDREVQAPAHHVAKAPLSKQIKRLERASSVNADHKQRLPCDKLITVPQSSDKGTCWFNAVLMVFLFSDGMRQVTKRAIAAKAKLALEPEMNDFLQRIASLLLIYKQPVADPIYKKAFDYGIRPEDILKSLSAMYPLSRNIVLGRKGNSMPEAIKMMIKTLGITKVRVLVADRDSIPQSRAYDVTTAFVPFRHVSAPDGTYRVALPDNTPPEVIIVSVSSYNRRLTRGASVPYDYHSVTMNGKKYKLDSAMFAAPSRNFVGQIVPDAWHAISGVTCNSQRFYYNGWKRDNDRPCPLMPVDWAKQDIYLTRASTVEALGTARCYSVKRPVLRRGDDMLHFDGTKNNQSDTECLYFFT